MDRIVTTESRKHKRKGKDYDSHCRRDRISDLPLSIIHKILSLIPTEEAVRTSILSRQWKYIWTGVTNLVFISNWHQTKAVSNSSEERLKKFITHALSIHKGSIHKFELFLFLQESCPKMDEWLLCLSTKDIRELVLEICTPFGTRWLQNVHSSIYSCNNLTYLRLVGCEVGPPPPTFEGFSFLRRLYLEIVRIPSTAFEGLVFNSPLLERFSFHGGNKWPLQQVHSSIYSCNKLTHLDLMFCGLDPPPSTFKGFLFLMSLSLTEVDMSVSRVQSLVSNCPLLEKFELSSSQEEERMIRINAPNLKYLCVDGSFLQIYLNAPLLAELSVRMSNSYLFHYIDEEEESTLCNYTNFFGGCTNLEKLIGNLYFTTYLSMGIEYCSHSVLLSNLKIVDLQDVNSEDDKEIMAVARLIMGAPNLNQLKLEFMKYDYPEDESEDGNVRIRDFLCAHNFSFEKLRFVRISGLTALFPEKELIKFLLESSPVLETMRIGSYIFDTDEIQSAVDDLLGCCRASPSARISFS